MSNSHSMWYTLQVYAGQEEKVKKLIQEQLLLKKMVEFVDEIFIPSEKVTTKKEGKEKSREIKYYPGYMLIKMKLTDDLWHLFNDIPKVSGFIGGKKKDPLPVSESEVEAIRGRIKSGAKQAEINASFTKGETVLVIEGPFADFNAIIDSVDTETNKLTVLVNLFDRSIPLELDFDKVRKNS